MVVAVQYLNVSGITEAAKKFRSSIGEFDQCLIKMDKATNNVLQNWVGKGRNQFETQVSLMKKQLDDISEDLYDIYDALVDSEEGYIEEDEAVAKQFDSLRT
jgi:WXG100 family type VII secretion target